MIDATNSYVITQQQTPTTDARKEFGVAQLPVHQVVAVGEDVKGFKNGDIVFFNNLFSGGAYMFTHEGVSYTAIDYKKIVGKAENE